MRNLDNNRGQGEVAAIGFGVTALSLVACLALWGCPQYQVYSQKMAGEAELAQADYTKRVAVVEAQAKLDSAKLLNQAEVARADGLAQATDRVAKSFGSPDNYLRYLWIQGIENDKAQVIYVPTEAGLPVLEAGHR